jgi:metallophosphoesterase (TIGR00282 family)
LAHKKKDYMNILYIGDIMGERGIEAIRRILPELKVEEKINLTIAQGENVTHGKGISKTDYDVLQGLGIDFFTGGNWTLHRKEIYPFLDDPMEPILRSANYPEGTPGQQWKYILTPYGKVLVVSLLGKIVGKDADVPTDNPLRVIDTILEENKGMSRIATIVNIHGDFSSEKVVAGYYLDGRVSAVVGDHWHVPTADAMVLPEGTAHITDVGMVGALHASLGVKLGSVIPRWRDNERTINELETAGPLQFNAVVVSVDTKTGLAKSIKQIQKTIS